MLDLAQYWVSSLQQQQIQLNLPEWLCKEKKKKHYNDKSTFHSEIKHKEAKIKEIGFITLGTRGAERIWVSYQPEDYIPRGRLLKKRTQEYPERECFVMLGKEGSKSLQEPTAKEEHAEWSAPRAGGQAGFKSWLEILVLPSIHQQYYC